MVWQCIAYPVFRSGSQRSALYLLSNININFLRIKWNVCVPRVRTNLSNFFSYIWPYFQLTRVYKYIWIYIWITSLLFHFCYKFSKLNRQDYSVGFGSNSPFTIKSFIEDENEQRFTKILSKIVLQWRLTVNQLYKKSSSNNLPSKIQGGLGEIKTDFDLTCFVN